MKFTIESTYCQDAEKLLKHYPFLREYGFETEKKEVTRGISTKVVDISYIHIVSLEDLLRLYEQCKEEIIITRNLFTDEKCIEIYDGYRE